jgi:ABC-2 type transport system ATP-binding protein
MPPTETETVIAGDNIGKVFKDFWGRNKITALSDVDIRVPRGSIFGLLGPNGAGKSTLIKLILGHLYPTNGHLAIFGKSPRDVAAKNHIGYLPERSYLYKQLTAAEILKYFGMILNLSKEQIENRTRQLLEMVGLESARDRMSGEFSHGMGRRLGLAQALLNDPDLLILDEPTAGLDPVGCREVKDLIITLGKRGKTVLLTSHLLSDVEDVCDELMLLYGGRVQTVGKVDDLLRRQDRMSLEFPKVTDATLDAAVAALVNEVPRNAVTPGVPSENLERYFLRMVAQRDGDTETAGARMGKGVAEYLRDTEYKDHSLLTDSADSAIDTDTLQSLSTVEEAEPAKALDAAPQVSVDAAALDDLSGDPQAIEPNDDDEAIDKGLLDDLTK